MQTIHLDPNQVPAHLKAGYNGRQFAAHVCETMTIPSDAGLWSGGSRNTFKVVRLADGAAINPPGINQASAPWDKRNDVTVALEPGIAVVEHVLFCGRDMGLRFYLNPADATPMLPPADTLTPAQQIVINATCAYKSSYMGKDRYQMARDNAVEWSRRNDPSAFITRAEYDTAKASLIESGHLNKAGAITTKGRNARTR